MKYVLSAILICLSASLYSSTDCWRDSRGGVHCSSSSGGHTDCWQDSRGGMHCN